MTKFYTLQWGSECQIRVMSKKYKCYENLKKSAQITRANRDRKKQKQFETTNSKCVYEIWPFPDKYQAEARSFFTYALR